MFVCICICFMMQFNNGILAHRLVCAAWGQSKISNPSGSCAGVAGLPAAAIAVRNSRHPAGPALIYTQAEVTAFLTGVKNGELDDLCPYPGGQRRAIIPKSLIVS
jgi:hypothetical protein